MMSVDSLSIQGIDLNKKSPRWEGFVSLKAVLKDGYRLVSMVIKRDMSDFVFDK